MPERTDPSTSVGLRGPSRTPARGAGVLTGWAQFGAVMMTIIGTFGVIEGLAALLSPTTYIAVNGTVLSIDLTAWGWLHLVLGALLAVTGVTLLREAPSWARGLGIGLVALSMLVQLAWMPAYPLWSILVIALDVAVIHSLAVTRDER